jgi:hypothetical protein
MTASTPESGALVPHRPCFLNDLPARRLVEAGSGHTHIRVLACNS